MRKAVLTFVLLLVSCSPSPESTSPTTSTTSPPPAGGAAAPPTTVAGALDGITVPEPTLTPALRGASTLGLATNDITNRTGENPTVSTWDGRVIVRRCPDPEWPADDYMEPPVGDQPGVVRGQYWCFHAFRPGMVALGNDGVPDFSDAFGPGFMSTTRHVSHTGGFPIVENQEPAARWNPYPSNQSGVACGAASLDDAPPACPDQDYVTYDVYIVHSVTADNPTFMTDYPDYPFGEPGFDGTPTYFEQMLIVVKSPETDTAAVADVIRNSTPYPMIADPNGFGFDLDPTDPSERNPYLMLRRGDTDNALIGGVSTIEPAATVDGRMVLFNGGDENPNGVNLVYTWNPNPAAQTGWSPPKNVAYMYYVEGPGAPGGETQITIDGVDYPFSTIFPIAKQPLVDQRGVPYDPGTTYVPARRNPDPQGYPYHFDEEVAKQQYLGSYPWISWDGRNIMSLSVGRFNVAVIGDLTNYGLYWIDGAIDKTDFVAQDTHEISAMWNLGQWPGRWAQFGPEFEGRTQTVPTLLSDAVTWAIFEQDHYSEISFHKTDGSYALYFPMSRMRGRGPLYDHGYTPDVSGNYNVGTFEPAGGAAGFSQQVSAAGYTDQPESAEVFGYSGNSVGFLTDATDPAVQPHIAAGPVTGIEGELTVEGAVYLETGDGLADPWTTIVRQPGAFSLGVDQDQHPWFEVVDDAGTVTRVIGPDPVSEDTWAHLTGVYAGGVLRLYENANLIARGEGTDRPVAPGAGGVLVGPANDGDQAGGDGLVYIDEVGVSPTMRRLDEIARSSFQRVEWPTETLAQWEQVWGEGSMPLGLVDENGKLLAPIHLGFDATGDVRAQVGVGEQLFNETGLSTTSPAIACASCHSLTTADAGAIRGEVTSAKGMGEITRNTPSVLNKVFARRQFWDGRVPSLADQLLFPITAPNEMAQSLDALIGTVLPDAGYTDQFEAAFGGGVTLARIQQAIVLYESGLVAGNSAVDRYRFLGEPLSPGAERGLALFETKARCTGCHTPPLYTDDRFHDNAQGNNTDPGREFITARESDFGLFRTMPLRDVAGTDPYMHDGSVATLREVVEMYNVGGDGTVDEMKPLGLTPQEIDDVVAFLEALRSDQFVVPLK